MTVINKSMDVSELNLQPPIVGTVRLSDDMQQTLALLTALGADRRRPLRCSESGILNVVNPRIKDILHYTGSGANDEQNGADIPCTEVMAMGHPNNSSNVWVRPNKTATTNNAWPLAAKEVVSFTLDNLSQLIMLIVGDGEKVIVAYTR